MHKLMCILTVVLLSVLAFHVKAQSVSGDSLTINAAVNTAIENNPELQVLLKKIEASKAIKIQSGLMPNPEFGLEAENILGNNDFEGFRGSEITATVSQNILLAGKINKLEKIADKEISLAEWNYEAKRLEIIIDVRKAFNNALAIKRLSQKNSELIKISNEFIVNLKRRVKAGKISPAEVSRSQIILNLLEININKLKSDYDEAIFKLKTLLNDSDQSFETLKGKLKEIETLPDYDSLLSKLKNNPNLKRFESEYDKQKAVITFEESKQIPDLTISAGYKRLNEVNANTFLVGLSLPLPIFNRNQGSIQEAKIRLDQKSIEYNVVKNKLTFQLNLYYSKLKMLLTSANRLKNESIPIAKEAFKIINEGNLVGRFTILDVLDAQRTLFEIQNQYLTILSNINTTVIEIEGLTVSNME